MTTRKPISRKEAELLKEINRKDGIIRSMGAAIVQKDAEYEKLADDYAEIAVELSKLKNRTFFERLFNKQYNK
jgi:hypothetical protein